VVAGLAFLEGRVLPVADLSRLLGGQSEHLRTVVITGSGEGTLALGVDAYLGVRRIADDAFEAPPTPLQEPAARYASTMTRDGILLLDLESIRRDLLSGASPV
jgi:chemotaxis signal transduction protein